MTKVDLITGFLGSGKTTFILKYVDYLKRQGEKVTIIENEFGGVSIDSSFLKDTGVEISEVTAGCMCCTGKAAFQTQLIDEANKGYDRIIVEPSGIYDVDEFFDTLLQPPVNAHCEIGSVLTIVDGNQTEHLSTEAQYLMFSQILSAGRLVLSKTQDCSSSEIQSTIEKIKQLMRDHGCHRSFEEQITTKDWNHLTDEDFFAFANAGYLLTDHEREFIQHGNVFTARILAGKCENEDDLKERLHRLMNDPSLGTVYRCKGFIQDTAKKWYEMNCSGENFYVNPVDIKRGIFLIIGQDLNDDELSKVFIPRGSTDSNPC